MEHQLNRSAQPRVPAGFSLIELLVVVAILAILSVGLSLSLGRTVSSAKQDSTLFQSQFDTNRALAISGQHRRGFTIEAKGLRPLHLAQNLGSVRWEASQRQIPWAGKVLLDLDRRSFTGTDLQPDIIFLRNGQTTAFTIWFGTGASKIQCQADGWTGLTCQS